jgi:hypothetical protein
MSRSRTAGAEMVRLSADDMARFERCAPAALARRGRGFAAETLAHALEQALLGGIPIVGMLRFDWSADQMLVFLLVGLWVGIVADVARLWALPAEVQRFGESRFDDWHVWVVVGALRAGRREAPRAHLLGRYEPWTGVVVDLACGAIGSAMIVLALVTEGSGFDRALLADRGVAWGLAALVGVQAISAAAEIVRHRRRRDPHAQVRVAPGMRGLGLFLLTFLVVMVRESGPDEGAVARWAMLAVNGLIVALAAFNAAGLLWLRGETRWLREYLHNQDRA